MSSGRRNVVYWSICPSICHQTCKHDILKINAIILLEIDTSGLRGKEMKRSTFGGQEVIGHVMPEVRRS